MTDLLAIAKEVVEIEIEGLREILNQLNTHFEKAVDGILGTSGRTIVCGMGKSGIIGKKIAASLASTGTPSFFMHPGEAFHGDLGMVHPDDVFIAISNSGETDEVLKILPFLRNNGNFVIAITGNPVSTLAKIADCHLNIMVSKEACPLQLAPTASTTAALVMGDALTVALMRARDFQPENFARFHPGGSLGRKLLSKVSDVMQEDNLPIVNESASVVEVIHIMTSGQRGIAIVTSSENVIGIITDGDLRRALEKEGRRVFELNASNLFTPSPQTISKDANMQTAIELMDIKKVNCLIVTEEDKVIGIVKK